jgi:hypothetical protein
MSLHPVVEDIRLSGPSHAETRVELPDHESFTASIEAVVKAKARNTGRCHRHIQPPLVRDLVNCMSVSIESSPAPIEIRYRQTGRRYQALSIGDRLVNTGADAVY